MYDSALWFRKEKAALTVPRIEVAVQPGVEMPAFKGHRTKALESVTSRHEGDTESAVQIMFSGFHHAGR